MLSLWGMLSTGAMGAQVEVAAAASLTDLMTELAEAFERRHAGHRVRLSFAGSSALARQVEAGAPVDVLVLANQQWMDYLIRRGIVRRERQRPWLGNTLVLVAPADAAFESLALAEALERVAARHGRLVLADPDHVPAGQYARESLQSLGLWARLAPRVVRADNVRAALALVARGEVPLGVVYATDARAFSAVRVVAPIPQTAHRPIRYALADLSDRPGARLFVEFLNTSEARASARRHGFLSGEARETVRAD